MTREQRALVQWVALGLACVAAAVLTVMALVLVSQLLFPPQADPPYCDPGTYRTRTSDGGPQCLPLPAAVR